MTTTDQRRWQERRSQDEASYLLLAASIECFSDYWLLPERAFEVRERALDPMQKSLFERDAVAEIAQQIGDRRAARLVKQPLGRERARRIGDPRVAAGQFAEGR